MAAVLVGECYFRGCGEPATVEALGSIGGSRPIAQVDAFAVCELHAVGLGPGFVVARWAPALPPPPPRRLRIPRWLEVASYAVVVAGALIAVAIAVMSAR